MAISFNCPHCDKLLKTPDDKAGVQANCPGCGQRLTVPHPAAEAPADDAGYAVSAPAAPAAAAVRSESPAAESGTGAPEDVKPCPMCGETIRKKATRCRFCGESLEPRRAASGVRVEPGAILSQTWDLTKANFGLLFGATVLMCVIVFAVMAVVGGPMMLVFDNAGQDPGPVEIVCMIFFYAILFAVSIYLQGGHYVLLLKVASGEQADISDLFSGLQYLWRILLGSLLLGVLAVLGMLMCVIPYFLVLMTFWPFAFVIVDQNAGVIEAFQRSRQITANHLATILVLGLALIGINLGVSLTCGLGAIVAAPYVALLGAVAYRAMADERAAA